MAGTFTQKRDESVTLTRSFEHLSGPYKGTTTVEKEKVPCAQVTTSYRSGARVPPESFEDELRRQAQIFVPARELRASHDTGHEFQTFRTSVEFASNLTGLHAVNSNRTREGLVRGNIGPWYGKLRDIPQLSQNDVSVYGGRAIAATAPTKPQANLSTTLGELIRDGIPSLPGLSLLRDKSLSGLGSEYLNVEFGWVPLVSDLQALLKAVVNSATILRQFKRDSGRIVRRRFTFPAEITFADAPVETGYGAINVGNFGSASDVSTHIRTERRMWFSGAYTYYLDVGDDLLSKAERYEQMANHLLGLRITPEVLWELTPWSWLADWFSNIGTALSNVTLLQSDGLVIRWGYLMCHTTTRVIRTGEYRLPWQSPVPCKVVLRSERKERFRATPYGFGISLTGLTSRQWAILAALGMTKADRVAF